MKYSEFYRMIADMLGQDGTKINVVPLEQMKPAMEQYDAYDMQAGKEHGIHMGDIAEIQDRDAYLNPEDTMPVLGYRPDDVRAAIRETLHKCITAGQ